MNYFGIWDYILLGATLLVSLLIGLYYGYKGKHTNEELLVGGRNMSVLPVAASVMVTYVSAITIVGFPSEIYAHGAQIYVLQLVSACCFPISAFCLMPFFYRMKLTSINEYLEKRFESVWIRWIASAFFMFQQLMISGIALYAPAIPLSTFFGIPMWMSIMGTGICATIYTNVGGLKAVVWTDAFQFFMMVAGMVAIVWRGFSVSGGISKSFQVAEERGRLNFFDFTFDPFTRHNFWNFLFGSGFHALMQPGVHQMQVQRYSGMPTCSKAKQAIAGAAPLKLAMLSSCLLTGLAIFAFYSNCDPMTKGDITKVDQIVPYFVVHELRDIPGMMGIFTSCIISSVLSTISSSINSMAAVAWEDFLSKLKYFQGMTPRGQTNVTRGVGVIFGMICIGIAFAAQNFGAMYSASYAIQGGTTGAIYGAFLMGLFLPFVNEIGVLVGTMTGCTAVSIVAIVAFVFKSTNKVSLPVSIEDCPFTNLTTITTTPTGLLIDAASSTSFSLDEWPWRIFSLSYLLYNLTSSAISILVGVFVSFLTSSYRDSPKAALVHPIVRGIFKQYIKNDSKETDSYSIGKNHPSYNENGIAESDKIPMSILAEEDSKALKQSTKESGSRKE